MGVAKDVASSIVTAPKKTVLGFARGFAYPFRGMKLVFVEKPGLIRFWIFPILLTMVGIFAAFVGSYHYGGRLAQWLWPAKAQEGFWGSVVELAHGALEVFAVILLSLAGVVLMMLITNIIAAPFNDALSEEVERIRTGKEGAKFRLATLLAEVARTIRLEATKLLLYALVMGPLFGLSLLVPVVGQIVYTVFGFLFTALYFAIDYVDWPASRRKLGVRYRAKLAGTQFSAMLGFGTAVWLLLFVPFVNLLFMPAAVAGGTLLFLDLQPDSPDAPSPTVD